MLIHQASTVMAFATFELPTLNVHVTCSLRTPLQKVYCCLVALSSRFVTHVHVVYCAIFAIANYYCFVQCSVHINNYTLCVCVCVKEKYLIFSIMEISDVPVAYQLHILVLYVKNFGVKIPSNCS